MPASQIYQVTKTLTNAQILALADVGIDIVPAQGAGTVIRPISAFARLAASGEYATLGTNDLLLALGGVAGRLVADSLGFLNTLVTREAAFYGANVDAGLSYGSTDLATVLNAPLQLWNWSGVNYSGGDAANNLEVTVLYAVTS